MCSNLVHFEQFFSRENIDYLCFFKEKIFKSFFDDSNVSILNTFSGHINLYCRQYNRIFRHYGGNALVLYLFISCWKITTLSKIMYIESLWLAWALSLYCYILEMLNFLWWTDTEVWLKKTCPIMILCLQIHILDLSIRLSNWFGGPLWEYHRYYMYYM